MKVKRKLGNEENKKKQFGKFTKKEWFYLVLTTIMYWLYLKTLNEILNYNFIYYCIIFSSIFIIGVLLEMKDKILSFSFCFEKLLKNFVFSFIISGVILVPLNYYIIDFSKRNPVMYKSFDIVSVSTSKARGQLRFEFMSKIKVLYSYDKILYDIKKHPNKFKLSIKMRKSILNTYVIDDWKIEYR
jgi:hypothetical protein